MIKDALTNNSVTPSKYSSIREANQALIDMIFNNCSGCFRCSGCSGCSHCSDCSGFKNNSKS